MSDLAQTNRGQVVCIGDLLVDVWWHVDTAVRNTEHAAVAINSRPDDREVKPGGVGIVADALHNLNFQPLVFSTVDMEPDTYSAIRKLINTAGINCLCHPMQSFCTPVKTRYVNTNGHILARHDAEVVHTQSFDSYHISDVREKIRNTGYLSSSTCCVVVSDYNKGCIPWDVRDKIVLIARTRSVPIYIDAKPAQMQKYIGASLFKMNMAEFKTFAAVECAENSLETAIQLAAERLKTSLLIVTDGGDGVYYSHKYGVTRFVPTPAKYFVGNCVGAGDVFLAGLVLGFSEVGEYDPHNLNEFELLSAIKFAIVTAGQRVRTNGLLALNAKKILDEVYRRNVIPRRLMQIDEFVKFAAKQRNAGKDIVFTNGCFDLLHDGHLQLLTAAKQAGDVLMVAVDADANVRRLKGEMRPIQSENTRAGNIAALEMVDAACVFVDAADNRDLQSLIQKIKPVVLIKGADYHGKEIVGADIVKNQNPPGRVVLVPLVPNSSTTAFVNKIKAMTP